MRDRWTGLRDRLTPVPMGRVLAKWIEAALLIALAVQGARLFWVIFLPLGMVGEWQVRRPAAIPAIARQALFRSFDPFTRGESGVGGNAQVTGLALQLFGTRINEGSGQGSAIIATPDGTQSSFIPGDEIIAGVTLKEVAFDHVVIDRSGKAETLFIDQSVMQASDAPPSDGDAAPAVDAGGGLTASMIGRDIGFAPRTEGGKVTGLVIMSKGAGFAKAGFLPGDVITQVNGRPINSTGDIEALNGEMRPGARISLMVERGAATVPILITLGGGQ